MARRARASSELAGGNPLCDPDATCTADLIIDDSERNADLYYSTGFLAPDPFVFLQIGDLVVQIDEIQFDGR